MSNWSIVIIAWSSVDHKSESYGHLRRMSEIFSHVMEYKCFKYIAPCGENDAPGSTCEVVGVGHANHFSVHSSNFEDKTLLDVIKDYEWQYPELVVVMYRDEHSDDFKYYYPCRELVK